MYSTSEYHHMPQLGKQAWIWEMKSPIIPLLGSARLTNKGNISHTLSTAQIHQRSCTAADGTHWGAPCAVSSSAFPCHHFPSRQTPAQAHTLCDVGKAIAIPNVSYCWGARRRKFPPEQDCNPSVRFPTTCLSSHPRPWERWRYKSQIFGILTSISVTHSLA